MVERRLLQKKITCLHNKTAFSKRLFQLGKKTMMISNLPKYFDGCYTEEALANLLVPYGFEYKDENIYVIPQSRMAFVLMPSVNDVHYILTVYRRNQVVLNNCFLELSVVDNGIAMTPIGFYKSLMKRMSYPVLDNGDRTIFITNISPSEARDLREVLRKIGSIVNYLPLLNKVFVQFESSRDADRLGVWYSLLKRAPAHKVRRLKTPHTGCTALVVPITKCGVPLGSISPFWVTMQASPYVFPTISPWFIIPEYLSVKGNEDIEKANRHASTFPTIMLTGLPEGDYRHEDVAMLVWPYFPKQNLHSLYYNVIVLTLQRRAFLHFSDWATCCRFARDHITNPVSVGGLALNIHFVLQNMFPDSKEELMYTSMMKWSNAGVPEPEGLEERLLCVEISETTVDLIKMVMTVVESIATSVNFLPLANRICVEMFDSGGVARVVKKYNTFSPGSQAKRVTLKKVIRFEPLKSLKQRLEEANEIAINLSVVPAEANPPAQPSPPSAESSSVAGGGVETEKDASGMVTCEEPAAGLPQIDQDTVRALKAAVRQHKRTQEKRGPSEEKESSSKCSTSCPSVKNENAAREKKTWYSYRGPVDFTEDHISSDAYLFEDQNFNMSDFVTVDEVGPDPHRSSSSKKSKKKKQQRLALRSSQSWAPSSHSSSKSTEVAAKSSSSANLTSVSTKKPKDQSQSTKPSSSSSSLSQREAVAASDHRASAEGIAAITVESEPEIETSSEMHPPAQGQGSGLNQAQNLEGQTQKDDFQKHKEEEEEDDDGENYQILDSFDVQTDEHMDDGNQVGGSETQLPEPENGRILNEENFQVLDSVSDDGENCPEKSSEEGATENQAATSQEERPSLVEHNGSTAKQLSEEDVIPVGDRFDDKPALEEAIVENQEANIEASFQVLGTGRKQASKGKGGAKERKLKEEDKIISAESCKASNNVNKPHEQIPNKLPYNVSEKKDVDVNEQESFEILDSIDDQTTMDDDSQKVETPSDQTSKDIEEEDTYQVVDSVEDQQTTTETESEVNATARKDYGLSKRSGPRTRASKSEEREKSPRKQDRAVKRSETITKTGTTAEPSKKDQEIEEELYEILDSIEEEPVQDATTTERSVRSRSQRGKKEDKTEASEKLDGDEETLYEVLDSVEDETATEQPTVMTRSTRGRRGRTTRKHSPIDKKKEEDTPTRRRRIPARESQQRTTKNEEKASPKEEEEKRSDITVREVRDEDATYEILDSVEDEEVFVQRDPEDLTGDVTQQETNEILDSMDNQTAIDDETPGDQISKEDIGHIEEEEDTYQVVDSVEDRRTTVVTESEVDATARKDDGSSKSSGLRTRQDRTVKKSETTTKIMCEIDSVEDQPVQGATATERSVRRQSQRGKKEDKMTFNLTEASEKPDGDGETLYEVLDSVEDKTAIEEPTVTTRLTRERRERTSKKDIPIDKIKEEDKPTRRRRTPARESAKKSDITVRESRDEDATYEILDSVEDEEVVKDDRPATGGRGKRGRPKKAVKATKKETVTLKKGDKDKEADEEEVSFQILDSVEDEMVDDHPSTEQSVSARKKKTSKNDKLVEQSSSLSGSPRNEEEEELVYQIVDSVEDDQEESVKETSNTNDETCPKEEVPAVKEDSPTCSSVVVEASEELVVKDSEDLSAAEESGLEKKERSDVKKEDASTLSEEKKNPESTRRNDTASALVNLDEVSDEEEDYPDDTAEEEELRKRQATAKEKQLAKEQEREREERKTREREERQRRSRGSSSQSGGRKAKERGEKEEKLEADTKEQERKTRERGQRSLSSSSRNDGRKAKERGEDEEEMVDEDSPPNVVKLKGVHGSFSHAEVVTAVEQFGKTISVVLFRSKREAVVRFEKDEDAKKLKSEKSIAIKGFPVTVVKEKDDEQKTPQKKPTVSSVSKPLTSKATKTTMPQRNTTYGKRTNEKTVAKGSTKVTKANILVAKAKNASTKLIAKRAKPAVEQVDTAEVDESANVTVAEPTQVSESVSEVKVKEETASSSAAGATIKEEVEEKSATPTKETLKSTNSGNRTDVETSESKELDTKVQSVEELEDTVKVEPGNRTVSELKHQAKPAKVKAEVANEDVEEVAEREEGSPTARDATADAAFGPTHSSEETTAELPQIDQDTFTALVAALHRHRLTKETRARSDKKEARGDAYDCTEQNFNMNDFVTVDEVVGDDAEETSPDPRRSASSKRPSRGRKEPQSLDASSDDKRPSTRSLRDSKRSSSSSSSSSKSTKDSTKRSSSSNSTKDSSRSTKSSTRPSSSLLSPETPSSPDHKTQQSKTRSPVKASKTSSSSCRTRSSRSSETLPESQREDVEATESAVPTSDHRVSAEGIAANAVESETKIETSPETHPPAQGQGLRLNQVQNLETDFKDNTLNDLEKAKVNNNSETCPEKCSEMELDSSLQAVDGATQNQAQQFFEKELPLNVCDRKDPKDLTCDVTQQETFEILDSVDDQTAIDDETSGAQISKEDIGRIDKEEDTSRSGLRTRQDRTETSRKIVYEMDSVEDEPVQDATTTERSVRRRSQRGKKEDKTEVSEKPYGDAEASFEVLDSVEDETATEEPTTTTSTRGRRERTSKKDSQVNKTKEEDTPTRRRRTPARESQEAKKSDITVRESRNEDATYEILDSVEDEEVVKDDRPATGGRGKRKRPKKAVKATKNETVTLKKGDKDKEADEEEVLFQILDSVEDEMVDDHPSTEQSVSARKKKTSKNDKLVEQSSSLSGSPRNEEEEEPVYQIVDSVEDDQEESVKETSKTNDETCPKGEVPAVKEDSPTCSSVVVEASEELVVKDSEDLSAAEESGLEKKERSDVKKEDASTLSEEKKNPESTRRNDTASALVNLDEVSDEEEDYPDDTAEEEELRKRQATAKEKQLAKEQEREREERKTREREERQRRSRGSSSQSGGRKAKERGEKEEKLEADTKEQERKTRERGQRSLSSSSRNDGRKAKERGEDEEEMVKVDTKKQKREQEEKKTREGEQRKAEEEEEVEVNIKELVTLDEVGADEAGEEAPAQDREWDGEITAEDLQGLVTLDEVVEEEEEEEGKAEQTTPEPRPPSKDDESVDSLNPDTLVTVDEARGNEDEETREEAETTSRSVKRKINVDTEKSVDFVTVDEVEEEEVKEAPRTRRRPRKRTKKTPVRKSTRGKKAGDREEERESAGSDAPLPLASPDKDPSSLSSDGQREFQKAEVDGASQAHVDAATAGQDLQPNPPESQSLEEGWSRADVTVVSKRRRRELVGPEAKRSRSQSPCASADLKLPPFSPHNPLGQEFVVPKSGYFCNLCRVFYLNESSAKEEHCGSQRHYDNLQKHYQKLEDEPSRGSTQYSQGSVSD
ncbi:putative zinc finger protein 638-like [Scophthalmus maximus]|uniref:Putative zinc finger protein 638-like n=1 Tax=Scophthalmus maximus TaxID=52904 RepID=A0A2U9B0A9_SCOMX|nr:putative zinc finger protein 638-like [Scophthalmus maximus]